MQTEVLEMSHFEEVQEALASRRQQQQQSRDAALILAERFLDRLIQFVELRLEAIEFHLPGGRRALPDHAAMSDILTLARDGSWRFALSIVVPDGKDGCATFPFQFDIKETPTGPMLSASGGSVGSNGTDNFESVLTLMQNRMIESM